MRLTNSLRDAIVSSILADVPHTDYDTQIRELAQKAVLAHGPKCVAETYKINPQLLNDRPMYDLFPQGNIAWIKGLAQAAYQNANSERTDYVAWPVSDEHRAELVRLREAMRAQTEQHEELKQKLKGVVYSVNTTQRLRELIPEFDSYIPKDEAKTTGVPALANLVTDLVKTGWPKGQAQCNP